MLLQFVSVVCSHKKKMKTRTYMSPPQQECLKNNQKLCLFRIHLCQVQPSRDPLYMCESETACGLFCSVLSLLVCSLLPGSSRGTFTFM